MPLAPNLTPRTYYNEQAVTTPANTADASLSVNLGLVVLQTITVLWPPGHNALTGFRFTLDGVQIVPWNQSGTFIFDSNERRDFDVGMLLDHPVVIHSHNSDKIAHTNFVTFIYTDVQLPSDVPASSGLPLLMR